MDPLGHGAIRFRHASDLFEQGAFFIRLAAAPSGYLLLVDAVLHRRLFFGRESVVPLLDRGGAFASLLGVLHRRFPPCE
ncbi:MAG: hypothetical protein E6I92_10885 [Chloroflexi bacterium]|nr:MAG: hypothetical protein E6I92_10885 [Chloroflexota bacterium]